MDRCAAKTLSETESALQLGCVGSTLDSVKVLVALAQVRISAHGYDQLVDDEIPVRDALAGLPGAIEIEDYPTYSRGPSVLVLQRDSQGRPIHIVWGIPAGHDAPAVLVTGYRPDPARWDPSWRRRK